MKNKIMITFQEGMKNGGPYVSHERIMYNLKNEYDFFPLYIQPGRIGLFNRKLQHSLVEQIRQCDPDIIHIHGLQLVGYQLMKAAKKMHKKTVLVVRGSTLEAINFPKFKKLIVSWCEKYTLKNANIVYGVSEYVCNWKIVKKYARNLYGCIYNFPNTYDTDFNKHAIRLELKINDDDIVIVSTGRITKEKGFEDLCSAIIKWRPNENIKFIVVGDGEYINEFKDRIDNAGMNKQVFTLGYRSDIKNILAASDIFTICTHHETLCNSILEAQFQGLPVVATNVGGIPEIIMSGQNGYLFDIGDINAIIDNLVSLVTNSKKRQAMSKTSKYIMQIKFSDFDIKYKILDVYEQVLGEIK